MATQRDGKLFMAGAIFGLVVGGLVVLAGFGVVDENAANIAYDTRVLATPPWVEPQVCYVAMTHKGDPGHECTPEGPAADAVNSSLDVSRDTMFLGSLTFAGLALFGSVFLRQTKPVKKSARLHLKICTSVVFEGTLGLALLHILFAGVGETFFSLEFVMSLSAVLMGAIVASYGILTKPQDE